MNILQPFSNTPRCSLLFAEKTPHAWDGIRGSCQANLPLFLILCLNFVRSARESPVAWEGDAVESGDNNQLGQPGGPEGHSSPGPNQGLRRWEGEEEPKDEQTQHEDEGSTSGVGSRF